LSEAYITIDQKQFYKISYKILWAILLIRLIFVIGIIVKSVVRFIIILVIKFWIREIDHLQRFLRPSQVFLYQSGFLKKFISV